jgi:hypothetical protein
MDKEVRFGPRTGADRDVHTTQGRHSRTRVSLQPNPKEVTPQVQGRIDPKEGLTQSHECHRMQDPRWNQVMQLQAIGSEHVTP